MHTSPVSLLALTFTLISQYTIKVSNDAQKELQIELLVDLVDFQGVLALMFQLLKDDCSFIEDKITKAFSHSTCSEKDNLLNQDDFELFMNHLIDQLQHDDDVKAIEKHKCEIRFQPKKDSMGMISSKFARNDPTEDLMAKAHLNGDGKFAAKNWSMLYCGGINAVVKELKAFEGQLGVGLAIEKFDW